jgi:hypothetical protein
MSIASQASVSAATGWRVYQSDQEAAGGAETGPRGHIRDTDDLDAPLHRVQTQRLAQQGVSRRRSSHVPRRNISGKSRQKS